MSTATRTRIGAVIAVAALLVPSLSYAYPFGGMIGQIIFCYNDAIYTAVGPPNGGPFIWTPSTRTYQFGPPAQTGQWLLGLAAPPYYCLVSPEPVIVFAGILMTMEGSSRPGAVATGLGNSSSGGGGGGTGSGGGGSTGIGHMVVSEIYPQADAAHGGKIEDQWIEIYNGSTAAVDLSRWTLLTASSSQTLPSGTTLAASAYMVLAGTTSVRTLWTIPSATQVLAFPSAFVGFVAKGDHVYLQNTSGTRIDAVSYGSDTSAFSPSVPMVQIGHSIIRKNLVTDTDTAADWVDTSAPTPGR